MRARELFLTPPPAAKPAAAGKKQVTEPKKVETAKKTTPSVEPPRNESSRTNVGGAELVNASSVPLGLRYSILKRNGDDFREVDPDRTFHSGDAIRVSVEANDTGHLYIVMRGTSGNWRVLFPSKEIDSGDNRVVRGRRYQIPSRNAFVFDENAGTEKLFLVLTRKPEPDLDQLIYRLSTGKAEPAQNKPEPKTLMLADSRPQITDDLVNRIRGRVLSRDLVFEKVDEQTPGDRKETAVYVVNHKLSADSQLVVDLSLKHQ